MSDILAFRGRTRAPTPSEIDLAIHISEYCQKTFGMKLASLFKANSDLTKQGYDALKAGKTSKHYGPLVGALYEFLTANFAVGGHHRLDNIHDWMIGPLCTLLPELEAYFHRVPSLFHKRIGQVGGKDEDEREAIIKRFGGERYIYRYARNGGDGDIPARIAKGRMTVPTDIDGMLFHSFSIEYQAEPRSEGAQPRANWIDGSILVFKAHFVFLGVERDVNNAFVMVIHDDGPLPMYGTLILRKHHERGYMASKGLVMDSVDDRAIGVHLPKDVPEITEELMELLRNIGNHGGHGPLTLPDV